MSSNKKLGKLEALRGAAAFYVMLGHVFADRLIIGGKNLSFLLDFGQEAVILFFVLSGFVIQYSFERSTDKSFSTFFRKRFFRIYIPLVAVFITNYLLLSWQKGQLFNPDWAELGGNLFMLQDASALKPNVICGLFLDNSPLWSLSYEWWFYMLFFIVATRYRKQASAIVYLTGLLAAVSYLFYPNFVNRILMYMMIWWVGADIAMLYLKGIPVNFKTLQKAFLVLAGAVLILGLNIVFNKERLAQQLGHSSIGISPFLELRHFAFAIISLSAAIVWKKIGWLFFDKTIGLLEPFAKISFGVYISHWFLVAEANYLDAVIANGFLRYTLYFLICFLFSFIIERKLYVFINDRMQKAVKTKQAAEHQIVSASA